MLAAAERVLERDGLAGLTLRAVAREAGVSHAAPTHHFGDLTGLLSELAAIGFRRFNEAMVAARQERNPSADEGDWRSAKAYVAYAQAHPGMYGLMFRTERLDMTRPSLHEAATASFEGLASAVGAGRNEKLTGEALEALSLDQAAAIARAWSLVHGFTTLLLDGRLKDILHRLPEGTERRPTAGRDAALDRRAAAGAVGQRFGGEFVSVGMDLRGERCLWRAAQQPLQILVCRASLASASGSSLGCRVQSSYRALASDSGRGRRSAGRE